jgi:branched-subunit amino acid transport protein
MLVVGLGLLAAGTFAFRLAGPALRSRVTFPGLLSRLLEVAAVVLLAALVAVTALTSGHSFAGYARPAGVLVAGLLAWRKAPFLVIVLAAASVTAVLRLLGVPLPVLIEVALDGLDLGGQGAGHAGPDVGLEHEADPGRFRADSVHGPLDHRHRLVPVAFDGGEHGVGVVRQAAVAHHPDRLGDDFADCLAHAERRDGKRDEHGLASCRSR